VPFKTKAGRFQLPAFVGVWSTSGLRFGLFHRQDHEQGFQHKDGPDNEN
jgi:hypothetical protein